LTGARAALIGSRAVARQRWLRSHWRQSSAARDSASEYFRGNKSFCIRAFYYLDVWHCAVMVHGLYSFISAEYLIRMAKRCVLMRRYLFHLAQTR